MSSGCGRNDKRNPADRRSRPDAPTLKSADQIESRRRRIGQSHARLRTAAAENAARAWGRRAVGRTRNRRRSGRRGSTRRWLPTKKSAAWCGVWHTWHRRRCPACRRDRRRWKQKHFIQLTPSEGQFRTQATPRRILHPHLAETGGTPFRVN